MPQWKLLERRKEIKGECTIFMQQDMQENNCTRMLGLKRWGNLLMQLSFSWLQEIGKAKCEWNPDLLVPALALPIPFAEAVVMRIKLGSFAGDNLFYFKSDSNKVYFFLCIAGIQIENSQGDVVRYKCKPLQPKDIFLDIKMFWTCDLSLTKVVI